MIASIFTIRYGTQSSMNWTSTGNDTSYRSGYETIVHIPEPLPIKEMMKLWAKERMRLFWSDILPSEKKPIFIIPERPISLRGVRLNGHGWAI